MLRYSEQAFIPNSAYVIDVTVAVMTVVIIMFIDSKWVDTRWQWSFNMLHMHGLWRLII